MVAILHPLGPGTQIPIDRAVVLVGRSPECDLVLDISTKISRLHCALIQVDKEHYIRDLGSMNGVMVAGKRVEKECRLVNGQEVTIGDVKYVFLENIVPAPRPARAFNGAKGRPVLIDEQAEQVEVVDVVDTGPVPTIGSTRSSNPSQSKSLKSSSKPPGGLSKIGLEPEAEIIDADDAVVVDADADVVELIEDFAELVEEVEVIDDAEIPDLVELVEDDEIIEDVEVIDPGPERPKPPRRIR
jgi:pSer/pThr/pTyr-binding forkhead associated (FHA) protein